MIIVMNEKTIAYWVESSEYDLITAEAMLNSRRYLYVGFMIHQTIEKILKAYFVFLKSDFPPRTHNLILLADKTDLRKELSEEELELLSILNPLNIETRYPKSRDKLLQSLTNDRCEELINKTRKLQRWVKQKLEIN